MSFTICEFKNSKGEVDTGNYIKMKEPECSYIEIMFGDASGMFKVINSTSVEEATVSIPSNIRDHFKANIGDEIIIILHKTIDQYTTSVTIRLLEKPEGITKEEIRTDFRLPFIKRFNTVVITPKVKYIFNVDQKHYIFSVITPDNVDHLFASTARLEDDVEESKKHLKFRKSAKKADLTNNETPISADDSLQRMLNRLNNPEINFNGELEVHVNDSANIEDFEIGGLDEEINKIIRLVSLSNVLSEEAKDMKVKTTKGILLHGEPGCGKTLLAKYICKKLNPRSCKFIEGPELNNKYIGQTSANIRHLFEPAEKDQKAGISGLHIVVFDEADTIFAARSNGDDAGSKHHNETVTQLLSKIQGLNELHNILIIIMTNRKEDLDLALIRSGRIDTHIEIKKPTKDGRLAILKIATKEMAVKNYLSPCVDLEKLSDLTKNFTGADITTMISNASTRSMVNMIDITTLKRTNSDKPLLTMEQIICEFNEMNLKINPPVEVSKDLDIILQMTPNIELENVASIANFTKLYFENEIHNYWTPLSILLTGNQKKLMLRTGAYIKKVKDQFDRVVYISPVTLIGCESVWSKFQYAIDGERSLIILNDIDTMLSDNGPFDKTSKEIMAILSSVIKPNKKVVVIMTCCDNEIAKKYNLRNKSTKVIDL